MCGFVSCSHSETIAVSVTWNVMRMSTTMHRHHYQPVSSTMAERNAKVSSEGPVGTYFSVLNVSLEAAFLLLRLVVSSLRYAKHFSWKGSVLWK